MNLFHQFLSILVELLSLFFYFFIALKQNLIVSSDIVYLLLYFEHLAVLMVSTFFKIEVFLAHFNQLIVFFFVESHYFF